MRTNRHGWARPLLGATLALTMGGLARAADAGAISGAHWQRWQANVNVENLASLQRGARDFVGYCLGCHSLRYERWSRLGKDLRIPTAVLEKDLIPPGQTPQDYILSRFCMIGYYAFFWLMPVYSRFDRVRPVPERVVYHAH